MRTTPLMTAALVLILGVTTPALAQQAGRQAVDAVQAETLIGQKVRGQGGEELGEILDLGVNSESGMIERAIVGVGGFLGLGERVIALDWNQLQVNPETNEVVASLSKADAQNAPEYQVSETDNLIVGNR
jgi:sporulation protein YlmC with PRC-barrel domain